MLAAIFLPPNLEIVRLECILYDLDIEGMWPSPLRESWKFLSVNKLEIIVLTQNNVTLILKRIFRLFSPT